MQRTIMLLLIFALALAMCAGCGDDSDDTSADGDLPDSVEVAITAADGGTAETAGGEARLVVPAGALAEDTTITIAAMAAADTPDAENMGSPAFEFGPDGLEFLEPVTLSLAIETAAPEGKTSVLAMLDGDKWVPVSGSAEADGRVSAEISHFSAYGVIHYGASDGATDLPSECADIDFVACGGDLVGSWSLTAFCAEFPTEGDNPFTDRPNCEDTIVDLMYDFDGTGEFRSDGTYTFNIVGTMSSHVVFDQDCLEEIAQGQGDAEFACNAIGDNIDGCVYADGTCTCDQSNDVPISEVDNGTWTTDGTTLTTVDDEGETNTLEYCVSGDRVIAKDEQDNDGEVMTAYSILDRE